MYLILLKLHYSIIVTTHNSYIFIIFISTIFNIFKDTNVLFIALVNRSKCLQFPII